ncbi:MAG: AAA family ATPase [Candidatus Poribacteria bacterium]|nr:AAA family ATPase [Candidatus Poribacteria bacterium]
MKLQKLALENLNSFQRKIELDFAEDPHLKDASLLAITGPTGSGKTTLLDALCVALYNRTPRLSSTGNQNPGNLLSQGKREGFAEVIFEANGTRYLSEWRVRRKRNGELDTPKVKLENLDTGTLISDRRSSHSKAVQDILGLDFESFSRSVLLAQGQFAAFLKADADTRRKILEATTGVDIYDKLRRPLSDKIRAVRSEHEKIETVFNGIPAVTSAEIEAARQQQAELETTTQCLEHQQQKNRQRIEQEKQRIEAHRQHIDAKARQKLLLQRQCEIERSQTELKEAQRAAALRAEQQAFQREKQNLEAAQNALVQAEQGLENAQNEYDAEHAAFDQIEAQYQSVLATRDANMETYNKARDEENRAQAQLEEAAKREDDLKAIEAAIDALSQELASQKAEQVDLEGGLEADQTFLRTHSLPADSDQRFTRAKAHFATLTEKWKAQGDKSKDLSELGSRIAQRERDLVALEKQREALFDERRAADAALTETELELQDWQARGGVENWQTQKQVAQQMRPRASEYENAVRQRGEVLQQLEQQREALNEAEARLVEIARSLELQTKDVALAEAIVKQCQSDEKYALIANQAIPLRKEHLHADQPCPVCGALEHPWADKDEAEGEEQIEHARRALAAAEVELQTAQERHGHLQGQHALTQKNRGDLLMGIDELQKRIGTFDEEVALKEERWRVVYPEAEISLKHIDAEIGEAESCLDQWQSAITAHTKALSDQKFVTQNLTNQAEKIQSAEAGLRDFKAQLHRLTDELSGLNEEIEAIELRFWECVPDAFREHKPQNALDQFEEWIDAVRECEKRLSDKQSRLNQLRVKTEGNARQLESEGRRKDGLETEIARYRAESEKLLAAAEAKTDGLKAAEAIRKLEAEVRAKTEARNHAEEASRQQNEKRIKAQAHKDRSESYCAECHEKFNAAQQVYRLALADAGFDSPEAHARAFRDDAWLKVTADEIDQYRQDLRTIEAAIASHEAVFAEQPFDPQVMERLQASEKELAAQIRSNTERIGELRKMISNMEENRRKREKQAAGLEQALQEKDRWENLQKAIGDNKLRNFALQRTFDRLIRLTNQQLERLTDRYALRVESMRDMVVIDKWNANEERPVETLSGGESFLTSLSLALALSEMSRGRTQLNSLFLDEGFGTLDTQTLDIAISALEGLRLTGRSIIVISHVGELTRRIPVQIVVEKLGNGSSTLRVRSPGG